MIDELLLVFSEASPTTEVRQDRQHPLEKIQTITTN